MTSPARARDKASPWDERWSTWGDMGFFDGISQVRRSAEPEPPPPAFSDPLLSLQGLTLTDPTEHGALHATQRVSLDVHDGERYVLLGPSGCGKSTLLKAAAGVVTPRCSSCRACCSTSSARTAC